MNRNMWVSIGLFAVGILAFGAGYALVLESSLSYLPGVGLTLVGGAFIGLAGAAAFRLRTGTVSRRRTLALVATFLGVGVGSVAITPVLGSGDLARKAFLVFFIPAVVYWVHKRERETTVTQTDERIQLLAYKAAFWVLMGVVLLGGVLLWARDVGLYTFSGETILAGITGIGLFGWYGAFRYLQTHN
ncbi:hypothetical protein Hrd1104_03245 [Halorhabdus sp. CBA1104]|uniref:hypothetical protein n=1 Tax=unclassified Halorhabdus TaxID=2621901 RepID=UPI0012B1959A|nr:MULTISPECIES: hypothetical protein [unclassified Halorhabdus]QGN06407.1 hypothetical protein Hrd1104_03245 [Halorhabdus sp. CBA1104]